MLRKSAVTNHALDLPIEQLENRCMLSTTPVITWAKPAYILQGTPLATAQLDATCPLAGKFVYTPTFGAILVAGTKELSVVFIPTNTVSYTTAKASVAIAVEEATVSWTVSGSENMNLKTFEDEPDPSADGNFKSASAADTYGNFAPNDGQPVFGIDATAVLGNTVSFVFFGASKIPLNGTVDVNAADVDSDSLVDATSPGTDPGNAGFSTGPDGSGSLSITYTYVANTGELKGTFASNESAGITQSISGVFDVLCEEAGIATASVDETKISPVAASKLNLTELYGSENVNVPITVNTDPNDVTIALSTDPAGSTIVATQEYDDVSPVPGQPYDLRFRIPTNLTVGQKYYFTLQMQYGDDADFDQGQYTLSDITFSSVTYVIPQPIEFVGTPSANPAIFQPVAGVVNAWGKHSYLDFIQDDLSNPQNLALVHQTGKTSSVADSSNTQAFIKDFENDTAYPYTDTAGNPTIGVGINLNSALTSAEQQVLVTGTKVAYAKANPNTPNPTFAQILAWLKRLATAYGQFAAGKKPGTSVLTASADLTLYNDVFADKQTSAIEAISDDCDLTMAAATSAFNNLSIYDRTVIDDIEYNDISGVVEFEQMLKSLVVDPQDVLVAVFQLVDAERTTQAAGLNTRVEAEVQELLWGQTSIAGTIL